MDVESGETLRHELFVRMAERNRLIRAAEFVVEAERFGSIGEIDRWVAGKAIEIAARGQAVDVNVSLRSAEQDFLALIRTLIDETGADPANLVLELGEAQLAVAIETRGEFVDGASELGCRIAIDGYVEGGRSSYLLRRFPIDFVKLNGRFIENLASDRTRRRALTTAVYNAHRAGARVIAESVESLVTLQMLEGLGVDEAQGNALGPPEPLEELFGTVP